ncbi:uncharacterized protein LOC107865380 [Capsicum annuum]|uniref:uncharacterized protein LOC107865380 n=1 Tax=Capsicum annuum TaxID=4072 RepID=UPI0007BFA134|nr:uncharacterized protein LOC107865380 [Capsicum annuum]
MEKVKMIRDRLNTAQSGQKFYVDVRQKELQFDVGNQVFLRVSPMKGMMRFWKKQKINPYYVNPYLILRREEVPVEIFHRQIYHLRTKGVALVKVLWRKHRVEEATWDAEEDMDSGYPFLFPQLDNRS